MVGEGNQLYYPLTHIEFSSFQDLADAANNRASVGWIIVLTHRPMYSSDTEEWDEHHPGGRILTIIFSHLIYLIV
jgi:hypothetical protein